MKKMKLLSLAALSSLIMLYGTVPAWADPDMGPDGNPAAAEQVSPDSVQDDFQNHIPDSVRDNSQNRIPDSTQTSQTDSTTPVITAGSQARRPDPSSDRNSRQTTSVITAGTAREDRGPGSYHWEQDERGWYYQNYRGDYAKDGWRQIRGVWYYFDSEGYMLSNAWVDTGGMRYRVGEDGGMLKSQTILVDGISYDLDETGAVTAAPRTEEDLQAEAMAAGIVASITTDTMDKPQKAAAIYRYVRGSMTYSYGGPGPESGEGAAALYGFRRHTGNCFEYYAMSKYLLAAAGMPSIRVVRGSDQDHFWNLVNVDGAWYHFDTTPRRVGNDTWCLVTTDYLARSWNAHNFDISAYPATP